MDRIAKSQWRDEIVQALDKSQAIFVTQFSAVTVEEFTQLRRELHAVQAELHVVKNSIAEKAVDGRKEACIASLLKGQTALVFAYGDVAAAAKILSETAKKNEKLKLVGGTMEGQLLTAQSVESLASLPPREVLVARIIGSLVAPHRALLGVLQGVPRAMVCVLNQIKEKKEAS